MTRYIDFEELDPRAKDFIESARENGAKWAEILESLEDDEELARHGFGDSDEDEEAVDLAREYCEGELQFYCRKYHTGNMGHFLGDMADDEDCADFGEFLESEGWDLELDLGKYEAYRDGEKMTEQEHDDALEKFCEGRQ